MILRLADVRTLVLMNPQSIAFLHLELGGLPAEELGRRRISSIILSIVIKYVHYSNTVWKAINTMHMIPTIVKCS